MEDIFNVEIACDYLKIGLIVTDFNSCFKDVKGRVMIKNDSSRFTLEYKEFLNLYKDSKFAILDEGEEVIDVKKDEEYYSFKHK